MYIKKGAHYTKIQVFRDDYRAAFSHNQMSVNFHGKHPQRIWEISGCKHRHSFI